LHAIGVVGFRQLFSSLQGGSRVGGEQPFIVIGDKTSHGGTVVGGATTATTHGKVIARVGDKVTCPKCGSTTIATGDNTMIVMGQPVARHGDKTACGATLIAGQSVTTSGPGAGRSADAVAMSSQPSDTQLAQAAYGNPDTWLASTNEAASAAPVQGTQEPPAPMAFSDQGLNLLKSIEVLRLQPYDDQTGRTTTTFVRGATVGYGHLIVDQNEWNRYQHGITEQQAVELLQSDVQPAVDDVNAHLTRAVSQQQFDALVLLRYNIGAGNFDNSSALRLINDPGASTHYHTLDDAWRAFNQSQGVVNRGVINRRNSELNVYHHGVYQRW
jgi:uncharacterized Zn-binding protein involved in type VI secretion/GH24 family phage-related lysozyme (muramidase)